MTTRQYDDLYGVVAEINRKLDKVLALAKDTAEDVEKIKKRQKDSQDDGPTANDPAMMAKLVGLMQRMKEGGELDIAELAGLLS